MPDPKLQAIAADIEALLVKHDVAGVVLLNSPTHGEYRYCLSPSWSCASLKANGEFRVRCKLADYPDQAAQKAALGQTVGMLCSLHTLALKTKDDMDKVLRMLATHVHFSHIDREENRGEIA
jgi:hypothetical protein